MSGGGKFTSEKTVLASRRPLIRACSDMTLYSAPHLFGALLLTAVFCTGPAQAAPVTEAEKTQCLAVGIAYSQIAQQDAQLVQTLRTTVAQPTVEDLQTFKDLDKLHEEAAEIGSILQEVYKNAPAPTPEMIVSLRENSQETLLGMVEACIPDNSASED